MGIERSHPLRRLFTELVERRFFCDLSLRDSRVAGYVSDLLTQFTRMDNLYPVCDARGRRLEEVGEMLTESNPLLSEVGCFERERSVRKHIGDFTLFWVGMFPESLARRRLARRSVGGGPFRRLREGRKRVLRHRLLL
jgi:hypothetical protein